MLAAAGLIRLGLAGRISARLEAAECVPAPGQGIVAVEAREEDRDTAAILAAVGDSDTLAALEAERSLVRALEGNCRVPLGAIATPDAGSLTLEAVVASLDGAQLLRRRDRAPASAAAALGERVAGQLLADGAAAILDRHRR